MLIKTDKDQIQNYLKDASNTEGFCDAVYFPESTEEIKNIINEAAEKKTNITISGSRTGLSGAAVPRGGIVISLERSNKIIEINKAAKYALVEPGVFLSDLNRELESHGLYFPPDPTELNCFIGGIVATNASGAKSFKYGATRNFVRSLDIILSTGELVSLARSEVFASGRKLKLKTDSGRSICLELPDLNMPGTKNTAGYYCEKDMDAIDLFVGSEGTLGLFSKIRLQLLDYPESFFSTLIFFNKEENALEFIQEIRNLSRRKKNKTAENVIDALAIEYFDKNSLEFLKDDYQQIPLKTDAAVWLQQETTIDTEEIVSESYVELTEKYCGNVDESWFAVSEKDRKEIENFRHKISAKVNDYISSHNFKKLGTDIAVPDSKMIKFYKHLTDKVKEENLKYVLYGHFGNSHFHLNMLPENEEQFEKAKNLYNRFCEDAVKAGGTFSAEHGVGKNKKEFLIQMYGKQAVNKMIEIKKALDAALIFNVGNVFDIPGKNAI